MVGAFPVTHGTSCFSFFCELASLLIPPFFQWISLFASSAPWSLTSRRAAPHLFCLNWIGFPGPPGCANVALSLLPGSFGFPFVFLHGLIFSLFYPGWSAFRSFARYVYFLWVRLIIGRYSGNDPSPPFKKYHFSPSYSSLCTLLWPRKRILLTPFFHFRPLSLPFF